MKSPIRREVITFNRQGTQQQRPESATVTPPDMRVNTGSVNFTKGRPKCSILMHPVFTRMPDGVSYGRREVCTSHHHEQWRYWPGFNDHHHQHSSDWNSSSLANIVRKKKPGSSQKFLICATKGENWEGKDSNPKNLWNTRKWTTTSRGAWKWQKTNKQKTNLDRRTV